MVHFREICKYGFVHKTCRCVKNTVTTIVDCDNVVHAAVRRDYYDWQSLYKVSVLDPDGWRRNDGVDFNTPITLSDFQDRIASCTVSGLDSMFFDL